MPTVERLASQGLRYNQFHTTALCSPTRTALLTGRNHHMNNMGGDHRDGHRVPGQHGAAPEQRRAARRDAAAERLQHRLLRQEPRDGAWEVSPSGPTDRWPTRSGFDKFYGFFGGETNQWAPFLYDGMNQVEIPQRPELPLHDRHDGQGDRLDAVPEVADARQAVLHVLRARRHPRAAPRAEGVDRQVQGQVRRRAGTRCAKRRSPGRSSSAWCRPGRSSRPSPRPSRTGTSCRPTRRSSSPARWRSSRASASTPTTRSAGSSTRSGTRASSTTRSSSTSSATTAPAPKAA